MKSLRKGFKSLKMSFSVKQILGKYEGPKTEDEKAEGVGTVKFPLPKRFVEFIGNFHQNQRNGKGSVVEKDSQNRMKCEVICLWRDGVPWVTSTENCILHVSGNPRTNTCSTEYHGYVKVTTHPPDGNGQFPFYDPLVDFKKHGLGELTYYDPNIPNNNLKRALYYGNFKDDVRCGFGVEIHYQRKWRYHGFYQNDSKNGRGCMVYQNGNYFLGNFRDGKRFGEGKMFQNDGNVISGFWTSDDKLSKGRVYFAKPSSKRIKISAPDYHSVLFKKRRTYESFASDKCDNEIMGCKWKFFVDEDKIDESMEKFVGNRKYNDLVKNRVRIVSEFEKWYLENPGNYFAEIVEFFASYFGAFYGKYRKLKNDAQDDYFTFQNAKDDVLQFINCLCLSITTKFAELGIFSEDSRRRVLFCVSEMVHSNISDVFLQFYKEKYRENIMLFKRKIKYPSRPSFDDHVLDKSLTPIEVMRKRDTIPYELSISKLTSIFSIPTPLGKMKVLDEFRVTLLLEMAKNKRMNLLGERGFLKDLSLELLIEIETEFCKSDFDKQKIFKIIKNGKPSVDEFDVLKLIDKGYNFGADDLQQLYFFCLMSVSSDIVFQVRYLHDWVNDELLKGYKCKGLFHFCKVCLKLILRSFRISGTIVHMKTIADNIESTILKGRIRRYSFDWVPILFRAIWAFFIQTEKSYPNSNREEVVIELEKEKFPRFCNEMQHVKPKVLEFFCDESRNSAGVHGIKVMQNAVGIILGKVFEPCIYSELCLRTKRYLERIRE